MQTDPRDKKTIPEDFIESTPEQQFENRLELDKEQDFDELVHNLSNKIASSDEEIDADDAIHNSIRELPRQTNTEIDPDDLVHGH